MSRDKKRDLIKAFGIKFRNATNCYDPKLDNGLVDQTLTQLNTFYKPKVDEGKELKELRSKLSEIGNILSRKEPRKAYKNESL